jgi:hypothetical protein
MEQMTTDDIRTKVVASLELIGIKYSKVTVLDLGLQWVVDCFEQLSIHLEHDTHLIQGVMIQAPRTLLLLGANGYWYVFVERHSPEEAQPHETFADGFYCVSDSEEGGTPDCLMSGIVEVVRELAERRLPTTGTDGLRTGQGNVPVFKR